MAQQHPLPSSTEIAGLQPSVLRSLAELHSLQADNRSAPQLRYLLNQHISRIISASRLEDGTLISSLSFMNQSRVLSEYGVNGIDEEDAPRYLAAILNGLVDVGSSSSSSSSSSKKNTVASGKVITRSDTSKSKKPTARFVPEPVPEPEAQADDSSPSSDSSDEEPAPRSPKRKPKKPSESSPRSSKRKSGKSKRAASASEDDGDEEDEEVEVAEPPAKRGRKKKSSEASAAAHSSSSTAAATAAQSQQNLFNGPAAFQGPFGAVAPSQGFGSGPFGAFGGGPQQGNFFGFTPNSWQAPFGSGGGWASGNSAAANGAFSMGGGFGSLQTFGSPGYDVVDPKSIPPSQGTPFSESFKSRCTNLESLRSTSYNAAMSAGINRLHKMRETRSLLCGAINEAHVFSYFGHTVHLIHLELNRLASGMVHEPSALLELGNTLSMLSSSAIECAQNRAFRQRYFLQRDQLDFKGLGRADQTMAESYEISTTSSAGALAIEKALRDSASFVARKAREDGITVTSSSTASSLVPFAGNRSDVGGNAKQRDKSHPPHRSRSHSP